METSNDIIDNTLEVMSNSLDNFDSTLGKVPIFKAGHNLGSAISNFIDGFVNKLPL